MIYITFFTIILLQAFVCVIRRMIPKLTCILFFSVRKLSDATKINILIKVG